MKRTPYILIDLNRRSEEDSVLGETESGKEAIVTMNYLNSIFRGLNLIALRISVPNDELGSAWEFWDKPEEDGDI